MPEVVYEGNKIKVIERIKMRGHMNVILVDKDKFSLDQILKPMELRVLDREYTALMPPIEEKEGVKVIGKHNAIDVNGLYNLYSQWYWVFTAQTSYGNGSTYAVLYTTTQSQTQPQPTLFNATSSIANNAQGLVTFTNIISQGNSLQYQIFFVIFDTTNNSYSVSSEELYTALTYTTCGFTGYTTSARIAYNNLSFTKSSNQLLFIVWLIEIPNIPLPLAFLFSFNAPYLQSITTTCRCLSGCPPSSNYTIYLQTGNCNFQCGGNCPGASNPAPLVILQNNTVYIEFPLNLGIGTQQVGQYVLFCGTTTYSCCGNPKISGNINVQISFQNQNPVIATIMTFVVQIS